MFANVQLSLKIYPVNPDQQDGRWVETQNVKRFSLKILSDIDIAIKQEIFNYLIKKGYGFTGGTTYMKDVPFDKINEEQISLSDTFNLIVFQ